MDVRHLIPGYEIISVISDSGGQSTVYQARQLSVDGRSVAIKVYRSPLRTEEDRRGFLREVEAMKALNGHPNVVRLDRADIIHGNAYIVMDLCEHSLADEVRDHGHLPADQVVHLALRVARALAAAHAKGILHRDLKPANLLRTSFGDVVVADFGIAALASGQGSYPPSGTPGYIAPETRVGQPPSVRSDVYSLGATLYTLLYGSAPVPGQRVNDSRIPSHLARAISGALSENPADRFTDMLAFSGALSTTTVTPTLALETSAIATSTSTTSTSTRPLDQSPRPRPPRPRPPRP